MCTKDPEKGTSEIRPPNQENRDVTTPSDSQLTGRHHQTKSGRSQSVFSSCAGLSTSKAALRGLQSLLSSHTPAGLRAELQSLSTKGCIVLFKGEAHQYWAETCCASLSCRRAAEGVALGCHSLGLWPKGRSNLEV